MTNLLYSVSTGGQSGGGSRMTTIQFLEAGLVLSDRAVRVIDADPANAGYTESTNDTNSVKLITLIRDGNVTTYIKDAAIQEACLLIDCGAGALSMAGEFVMGLRDALDTIRSEGYQHTSVFPVNSNKALVERILVHSVRQHQIFGKVAIGTTDLAGSNHFPAWLTSAGVPIIQIPLVATGFIDLRMRSKTPLSAWLTEDVPDIYTAKAAVATAILSLFNAPEFAPLLSPRGRERLLSIKSRSVTSLNLNPKQAAGATDEVLRLEAARSTELTRVWKAMRADPSSPLQDYFAFDEPLRNALAKAALRYPAFVSPKSDAAL